MRITGNVVALAAAVALTGLVFGCAQQRDAINRVQANVVDKSFFVGEDLVGIMDDPEFHMRGTIVDVGYGAAQKLAVAKMVQRMLALNELPDPDAADALALALAHTLERSGAGLSRPNRI